ncbi:MAG: hypothetical protein LQ341_005582 [Variospora aurantia]|nr:MAG: hypothetical protein LQ341_005582 [Variospora aurantia]
MAFFDACIRTTCYKLPFGDGEIHIPKPSKAHPIPRHKSSVPAPPSQCPLDTAGLLERLEYVKTMEQRKGARKVSDRTMAFLNRFKDQCVQALTMSKGKKEDEIKARISVDDGILESMHEKIQGPDGLCQMIVQSLEAMREVRILTQFGDYAAYSLQDLKKQVFGMDAMIWRQPEHMTKDWQEINKMIQADGELLAGYIDIKMSGESTIQRPKTPWLDDVTKAAAVLRVPLDVLRYEIDMYARRNALCHNGVKRLIEERRWGELAAAICRDKKNLEIHFPDNARGQTQVRVMIGRVQHRFFDICQYDAKGVWYELSEEALKMDEQAIKRQRDRNAARERERQRGIERAQPERRTI